MITSGPTGGLLGVLTVLLIAPAVANAQTDYYNTDRGRPFHIEDAYPVERRAFELQAAPLRVERGAGGAYHWSVEPEMAYGILPRTQLEVGVPLAYMEAGPINRAGVGGVDVSVLHNLNVETAIPALAVSASALLPVGEFGPDQTFLSFGGIMTRTFTWMRFHVNGNYTLGEASEAGGAGELSRWSGGIAMDRTFPLRSVLIGAELVAEQPLDDTADLSYVAGVGMRRQLTPRWAMDAGVGKRLTGDDRSWYVTIGSAYAFGLTWRGR